MPQFKKKTRFAIRFGSPHHKRVSHENPHRQMDHLVRRDDGRVCQCVNVDNGGCLLRFLQRLIRVRGLRTALLPARIPLWPVHLFDGELLRPGRLQRLLSVQFRLFSLCDGKLCNWELRFGELRDRFDTGDFVNGKFERSCRS